MPSSGIVISVRHPATFEDLFTAEWPSASSGEVLTTEERELLEAFRRFHLRAQVGPFIWHTGPRPNQVELAADTAFILHPGEVCCL